MIAGPAIHRAAAGRRRLASDCGDAKRRVVEGVSWFVFGGVRTSARRFPGGGWTAAGSCVAEAVDAARAASLQWVAGRKTKAGASGRLKEVAYVGPLLRQFPTAAGQAKEGFFRESEARTAS